MRIGQRREDFQVMICSSDAAQRTAAQKAVAQWDVFPYLCELADVRDREKGAKVLLLCNVQEWSRSDAVFTDSCAKRDILIVLMGEQRDRKRCICALKTDADDYILAPYETDEFSARIEALLRRTEISLLKRTFFKSNLYISLDSYTVCLNKIKLDMPPKEIELLYFLAMNQGIVFSRRQLLEQVWGFSYFGDSRTVDVHIKRLREKMRFQRQWKIETVWGIGYKLEEKEWLK